MRVIRAALIAPLVVAFLTACHGAPKAPVGQVVATVDGQEITVRDLNAELGGASITDPKARRLAEQSALRAIISRKLLAAAARAQGIDKTPDFAIQRQRALDGLLAQALAQKIIASVPAPSREEANNLITAHPDSFSDRKIFTVDQIRVVRPRDPQLAAKLKPVNTMDAAEALLKQDHVDYARGDAQLDALSLDPTIVDSIAKLPPTEVFVLVTNGGMLINQIKSARIEPFTGEPAVTYAMRLLKQQHSQEAAARAVNAVLVKGAKSVRYNKAFAPDTLPARPTA